MTKVKSHIRNNKTVVREHNRMSKEERNNLSKTSIFDSIMLTAETLGLVDTPLINWTPSNVESVEWIWSENASSERESILKDYPELTRLAIPVSGHSKLYALDIASGETDTDAMIRELQKSSENIRTYIQSLPENDGSRLNRRLMAETLGHAFTREEVEFYLAETSMEYETNMKLVNSDSSAVKIMLSENTSFIDTLSVLCIDGDKEVAKNARQNMDIRRGEIK